MNRSQAAKGREWRGEGEEGWGGLEMKGDDQRKDRYQKIVSAEDEGIKTNGRQETGEGGREMASGRWQEG